MREFWSYVSFKRISTQKPLPFYMKPFRPPAVVVVPAEGNVGLRPAGDSTSPMLGGDAAVSVAVRQLTQVCFLACVDSLVACTYTCVCMSGCVPLVVDSCVQTLLYVFVCLLTPS